MKFNLIDFRVLFALFVCLCLFVGISSISAAEVNDGIGVEEFDANEVQVDLGEMEIIPSESADSDAISDKQTDSSLGDNDSSLNDHSTTVYKYVIKNYRTHKSIKDQKQLAGVHKYYKHFKAIRR